MSLEYTHIGKAAKKTGEYLDGRRKGTIRSLHTSSRKLNRHTLDGIQWGSIVSVAGLSGGGKSIICEQLKRDFVECNPLEKIKILSFEFEMLSRDQIIRAVSSKTKMSTKELQTTRFTDDEFEGIQKILDTMGQYPIWYVDDTGTVPEIRNTVAQFVIDEKIQEEDYGLIVTIDHVLLTKGKDGDNEKKIIDDLYKEVMAMKKLYDKLGIRVIFLLLSQLNRKIEEQDRVLNPALHHPTKGDLFGASSVYYSSDYVLVTHKPSGVEGIEGTYGPLKLPLFNPEKPSQAMIYWHLIKHRGGVPKIMMMLDNFKNSRVDEYYPPQQPNEEDING